MGREVSRAWQQFTMDMMHAWISSNKTSKEISVSRTLILGALFCAMLAPTSSFAESTKASAWVGRVVVTTEGELLGRIEDFAIDVENKSVDFVVVSIGSFLIDDNLIAVHPDALGLSADGLYLVLYTDDLDSAQRFGKENWPSTAGVMPSQERVAVNVEPDQVDAENTESGFESNRSATISSANRTATMKAGEKRATIENRRPPAAQRRVSSRTGEVARKKFSGDGAPPVMADSEFDRMDDDGDGYLSRREIGARLASGVKFNDFDFDGNEGIDAFEFQLLKESS